jgi:hypothetical protein
MSLDDAFVAFSSSSFFFLASLLFLLASLLSFFSFFFASCLQAFAAPFLLRLFLPF